MRLVAALLVMMAVTAPADAAKKLTYCRVGNGVDANGITMNGDLVLVGGSTDVDATVTGSGNVYFPQASGAPEVCQPKTPLTSTQNGGSPC